MAANPPNPYLQAEILSADPVKLVQLLYRGAIEAVGSARKHLAAGEIRPRSKSIVKAWEILLELIRSLDHSHGGDLSRNLSSLYAYMQKRLMEANSFAIRPAARRSRNSAYHSAGGLAADRGRSGPGFPAQALNASDLPTPLQTLIQTT